MEQISQHTDSKEYKVQIAKNSCYDMCYDGLENRIYFTIHGFWKNKDGLSELLIDWGKALLMAQSEFTILADMSTMITHPQELNSLHLEVHAMIREAKVRNIAYVMPSDKIAYLQVQSLHERTNLPSKSFPVKEKAKQWLDIVGTTSSN
jgi:hypothetical protein